MISAMISPLTTAPAAVVSGRSARPGAGRLDRGVDLHERDGRGVVGPAAFGRLLDRPGIGADSHVVLAGGGRPLLAATAYWAFAYHSHPRLSLLDGGLPAVRGSPRP